MINGQSLTPLACSVKVKVLNDVISEATTESGGGCRAVGVLFCLLLYCNRGTQLAPGGHCTGGDGGRDIHPWSRLLNEGTHKLTD